MKFLSSFIQKSPRLALTLAACISPFIASESLAAVTVVKTFTPSTIEAGQSSGLSYVFTDADGGGETALALAENFGSASFIINSNNCGFTAGIPMGSVSSLNLTGGSLAPGASCTFGGTLSTPPSTVPDAYTFSSTVSSTDAINGASGDATVNAALVITESVLSYSVTFNQPTIAENENGAVTYIFTNNNAAAPASSINFNHTFNGFTATPSTSNCGIGVNVTATNMSWSSGTLAAGATCNVQISLSPTGPGSYINTTGDLTSSLGNSGNQAPVLTVTAAPSVQMTISPNVIEVGNGTNLVFDLLNPTASTAGSLAFELDLTATGLMVTGAPSSNCGGTLVASGTNIQLSAASLASAASCQLTVPIISSAHGSIDLTMINVNNMLALAGGTANLQVNALMNNAVAAVPSLNPLHQILLAALILGAALKTRRRYNKH